MNIIKCFSCETENPERARFCKKCKTQLKCNNCEELLEEDAEICVMCGQEIGANSNNPAPKNKIKFTKNAEGVDLEMDFSDDVAKTGLVGFLDKFVGNDTNNTSKQIETTSSKSHTKQPQETFEDAQIVEEKVQSKNDFSEIPSLYKVERSIECTEPIWIAIYAFYASKQGGEDFSKQEVREKYLSKRDKGFNKGNFTNSWNWLFKPNNEYFKTNDGEVFFFNHKMIPNLIDIINGKIIIETKSKVKSSSTKKQSTTTTVKPTKSKSVSVKTDDFDISANKNKPSLKDFLDNHKIKEKTTERILAIAYYINQYNKIETFTEGNIDYAYKALQLTNRIRDIYKSIKNLQDRKVWFKRHNGKWLLTRAGEIFFEDNFINK